MRSLSGYVRLAALEGHYDIVQILLSGSADIDSKDADGRSTLYVLALDNRLAMSKYFIQQGADVETRDLEVLLLGFGWRNVFYLII